MVTDYEAAWIALAEHVSSKTQHGREGLLGRMADLAAEHRVPAGELSRLLRLYGVEVERARSMSTQPHRDEATSFGGGLASTPDRDLPGHHDGSHDGSSSEHDAAPARA